MAIICSAIYGRPLPRGPDDAQDPIAVPLCPQTELTKQDSDPILEFPSDRNDEAAPAPQKGSCESGEGAGIDSATIVRQLLYSPCLETSCESLPPPSALFWPD
jgi:hypothetical protein